MTKIIAAIVLFAFQVVVLNHLEFSAYLYPQLFILILIMMPASVNKTWQMVIAFGLGLLADLFVGTPGLHASSSLLIALLRIGLLNRYDIEEVVANRSLIHVGTLGLEKFIYLALILTVSYHAISFGLESIGALNSLNYLLTVLLSSVVTFLLILSVQFMFYKR